ncbi:unnamed protein product, partial [Effrenium voratum]
SAAETAQTEAAKARQDSGLAKDQAAEAAQVVQDKTALKDQILALRDSVQTYYNGVGEMTKSMEATLEENEGKEGDAKKEPWELMREEPNAAIVKKTMVDYNIMVGQFRRLFYDEKSIFDSVEGSITEIKENAQAALLLQCDPNEETGAEGDEGDRRRGADRGHGGAEPEVRQWPVGAQQPREEQLPVGVVYPGHGVQRGRSWAVDPHWEAAVGWFTSGHPRRDRRNPRRKPRRTPTQEGWPICGQRARSGVTVREFCGRAAMRPGRLEQTTIFLGRPKMAGRLGPRITFEASDSFAESPTVALTPRSS